MHFKIHFRLWLSVRTSRCVLHKIILQPRRAAIDRQCLLRANVVTLLGVPKRSAHAYNQVFTPAFVIVCQSHTDRIFRRVGKVSRNLGVRSPDVGASPPLDIGTRLLAYRLTQTSHPCGSASSADRATVSVSHTDNDNNLINPNTNAIPSS